MGLYSVLCTQTYLLLQDFSFSKALFHTNKVKLYSDLILLYVIIQNCFTTAWLLFSSPSSTNHFTEYQITSSSKPLVFQNILHRMQSFPLFLSKGQIRSSETGESQLFFPCQVTDERHCISSGGDTLPRAVNCCCKL